MKGHLESLSAYAGWLPWPCEESGPTLTVQCSLHLSFRVSGRSRLSFLDRFFLVSEMAFFHQMMKGWCGWLRGPDEGPEFSRCRQDPGCLRRNPSVGAPTSVQTWWLENPPGSTHVTIQSPVVLKVADENITGPLTWKAFTSKWASSCL